jgi:hypothetical protein
MDKQKLWDFVLKVQQMAKEADLAMFIAVQDVNNVQCKWFIMPKWSCVEAKSETEVQFKCTEAKYPTSEDRNKVTADTLGMLMTFGHVLLEEGEVIQEMAEHVSKEVGGITSTILKKDNPRTKLGDRDRGQNAP